MFALMRSYGTRLRVLRDLYLQPMEVFFHQKAYTIADPNAVVASSFDGYFEAVKQLVDLYESISAEVHVHAFFDMISLFRAAAHLAVPLLYGVLPPLSMLPLCCLCAASVLPLCCLYAASMLPLSCFCSRLNGWFEHPD